MTDQLSPQHSNKFTEEEKKIYRMRFRHDTYKKVRDLFRRLHDERGLTQKAVAEKLGISESLVSKRLRGQANLTMDTLCDLARAMGARIDASVVLLEDVRPSADTQAAATPKNISEAITAAANLIPNTPHEGMMVWRQGTHTFNIAGEITSIPTSTTPQPGTMPHMDSFHHLPLAHMLGNIGLKQIAPLTIDKVSKPAHDKHYQV